MLLLVVLLVLLLVLLVLLVLMMLGLLGLLEMLLLVLLRTMRGRMMAMGIMMTHTPVIGTSDGRPKVHVVRRLAGRRRLRVVTLIDRCRVPKVRP
jgi:hypothetical protein